MPQNDLQSTTGSRVDATIARSWLLVNASVQSAYMAAARSDADQVILDIEDAVDPRAKDTARASVASWLRGVGAWVRINDRATPFWADDVDQLRGAPGLAGVVLAKTERPDHVDETFERLGGHTPIIPLIESAMGIENAVDIAHRRGVLRLAFGSGDYRRDTSTAADDLVMAYPRSRLVVASRVAGLVGPIDGPAVTDDMSVLREKTSATVAFGLTGKLVLHPDHTGVVNSTISPSPADTAWATKFLSEFEAGGRVVQDGSDLPRLKRAERITQLANQFGIAAQ